MRLVSSAVLAVGIVAASLSTAAHATCPAPMGGWGSFGIGPGEFNLPIAVIRDPSNRWLICDQHNSRVQIFDMNGSPLGSFGSGDLFHPSGIVVGPDNLVYVSSHQQHRVVVFNLSGAYVRAFSTGFYPVGVTVDAGGHIYVGASGRVQKFLLDGTFVQDIGAAAIGTAYGVRYGPDGYLWVSDYGNHRVHRFTTSGTLVGQMGGLGNGPGQFYSPENVAFGADGRVYIVDTGNDRVQVFGPGLVYECSFGSVGTGPDNFDVPTDAAFDALGRLVIPDYANHRIRIWGYPPTPAASTTWGAVKLIYR